MTPSPFPPSSMIPQRPNGQQPQRVTRSTRIELGRRDRNGIPHPDGNIRLVAGSDIGTYSFTILSGIFLAVIGISSLLIGPSIIGAGTTLLSATLLYTGTRKQRKNKQHVQ